MATYPATPYEEGYLAYFNQDQNNPYFEGTEEHGEWETGYCWAEDGA